VDGPIIDTFGIIPFGRFDLLNYVSTGYSTSALQTALTEVTGAVSYLRCSGPRYSATSAERASGRMYTGFKQLSKV